MAKRLSLLVVPLLAVLVAAVLLLGHWAVATAAPASGSLDELNARIAKLEARVANLEAGMRQLQSRRPMVAVPTPGPSQGQQVPDTWRQFHFNGADYYIVPLDTATKRQSERDSDKP